MITEAVIFTIYLVGVAAIIAYGPMLLVSGTDSSRPRRSKKARWKYLSPSDRRVSLVDGRKQVTVADDGKCGGCGNWLAVDYPPNQTYENLVKSGPKGAYLCCDCGTVNASYQWGRRTFWGSSAQINQGLDYFNATMDARRDRRAP